MARWTCKCGQYMNNHNCPDSNLYRVYSDNLWETISEMTDENNKLNWFDIPAETFEMYKCPSCGRLMIYDEVENRFVFYERMNDILR